MSAADDAIKESESFNFEVKLLLETIFEKYSYDFRGYAMTSVRRRVLSAMSKFDIQTVTRLQERVLHDDGFFFELLQYLTVPTSEMFRDPTYFLAVREKVVPILKTYPSIKLWIAGCSTGEEVYSFAILFKEENILDRSMIYATDINPASLKKAEQGILPLDKVKDFTLNYQKAGGKASLSDYYTADYGSILMDKNLRKNVVFADHSLATDQVFSEVQMVSCRNVLIYFEKELQDRALNLFWGSLPRKGFLGLGSKESIRFSGLNNNFTEFSKDERIYQRL